MSNRLYKSWDYGTNWTIILTSINGFGCMFELNNGDLIAGRTNGINLSIDSGTNWSVIPSAANYKIRTIFRASDNNIYASGWDGILKSLNEGVTWTEISSEACNNLIESDDGIFYKASYHYNEGVSKSFNNCVTWQNTSYLIKNLISYNQVYDVVQTDNGKIYASCEDGSGPETEVFRSGYVLSSEVMLSISPYSVKNWASFTKADVLNGGNIVYEFQYSTNAGNNWSEWFPLNNENLQSVKCGYNDKDRLKVKITLHSLNHSKTPEINWISVGYDDGYKSNLDNIVVGPNPWRPNSPKGTDYVTFYNLPREVTIKVYSIAGGLVASLDNIHSTGGRYKWVPENDRGKTLKSGVYICYVTDTNGHSKSFKLMVIK